jgi:hypothetical protein
MVFPSRKTQKMKRTPRPIKIPSLVAKKVANDLELQDRQMKVLADNALAQELHFGLFAISNGAMNDKNFQRISSVVNLAMIALSGKIVDRGIEAAIDGCARTLREVDARYEKLGSWALNEFQVASIRAGVLKIEESLHLLTMQDLRMAQYQLEQMK